MGRAGWAAPTPPQSDVGSPNDDSDTAGANAVPQHNPGTRQIGAGLAGLVELVRDRAHVRLEVPEQFADAGRESRARAGDDRECVVQRRAEGDCVQALGIVGLAGEGAGKVGIADAGGDQAQRNVFELDFDLGLQADAVRLGPFGELAANWIVLGERAACFGGDHTASGAYEQVGAEEQFELADLLGDCGL